MTTFAIATLGCKVNTYESQGFEAALIQAGYAQVSFKEKADIYIINTCAVTNMASSKSRQKIHQARAKNQDAILVAIGCYVQSAQEEVQAMEGVDILIGSDGKQELVDRIARCMRGERKQNNVHDVRSLRVFEPLNVHHFVHQTRAFLKIQDGCNQFCSYCIIPYARGGERSLPGDDVIANAKQLVLHGHLEIVLSGIHTGRYNDGKGNDLLTLLKRMCKEVADLKRIRISSIEMNELHDDFIQFMKDEPRIARHLHIPIQSGDNGVLKRMKRPYTIEWYAKRIAYIRSAIPNISISSDVITGFPQEDEQAYENTYQNVKQLQFSFLHIFPYSARDYTAAAQMHGHIENKVKKERAARLAQLSNQLYTAYKKSFIGKNVSVIFEKEIDGMYFGHSSEYLAVYVDAAHGLLHTMAEVTITSLQEDTLYGVLSKGGSV